MMHVESRILAEWILDNYVEDKEGKSLIDVGSLDVNGSYRPAVESAGFGSYFGVDLRAGKNVDATIDPASEDWSDLGRFDVVLSGNTLEHVAEPERFLRQLRSVMKPGGTIVLLTLQKWPIHFHPGDFWRFLPDGLRLLCLKAELNVIRIGTSEYGPANGEVFAIATDRDVVEGRSTKRARINSPAGGFSVRLDGGEAGERRLTLSGVNTTSRRPAPVEIPADGGKFEIGAGRRSVGADWIKVDADARSRPEIVATLPPVPEQCRGAKAFRLIHVLEHFHEWEARALLREFFEFLRPGGELILELPNLESAIGALSGDGRPVDRWGMWSLYGDPRRKNPLYGHKWGWTPSTLTSALVDAGFSPDKIVRERPKYHVPMRDFRLVSVK